MTAQQATVKAARPAFKDISNEFQRLYKADIMAVWDTCSKGMQMTPSKAEKQRTRSTGLRKDFSGENKTGKCWR